MAPIFHLEESATPLPFEPALVDDASDAELDALDVGVVGLDEQGTILRYNLYESRLARLDRNQVLGKNFFEEVAPCTQNDAFEGRFRRFIASDDRAGDRFNYLFDFKFGAQEVTVEFARARSARRYYLLIRRLVVRGPRAGLGPRDVAVEQRALAPDERNLGVQRDDVEMRVVHLPWSFLAALRSTCDKLAPESWPMLCHEWGIQWGRRAAVDLESAALERHAKGLRELTMRTVGDLVADTLRREGWGQAAFDFSHARHGLVTVDVARSALAESTRLTRPKTGAEPPRPESFACHLLAGCLGAVLSHVAQRRLIVRETYCAAAPPRGSTKGAMCTFVAVGSRRRRALESAIEAGARDIDAIQRALAAGPGAGAP